MKRSVANLQGGADREFDRSILSPGKAAFRVLVAVACWCGLGSLTMLIAEPMAAQNPVAAQMQAAAAGRRLLGDGNLHVILCGTSGPLFAADRSGPCTAILAGGYFFVVDAGAGSLDRVLEYNLPIGELTAVLLTHFHSDHMTEVGEINFAHWTRQAVGDRPLLVVGPRGVERVVEGFRQAYAMDTGFRIAHHGPLIMPAAGASPRSQEIEFGDGESSSVVWDRDGVVVTAFLVDHPSAMPAVGYRVDFAGRSVVVSGDTRRSANLARVAKGVDLLVHEVIADSAINIATPALERSGNPRGARVLQDALGDHTFPPDVFAVAAQAGAHMLVMSHLVPPLPPATATAALSSGRDVFAGDFVVGEDGMHFVLPPRANEGPAPILQSRVGAAGDPP